MPLIKLSHCVYQCDYHIILVTKYWKKIFNKGIFSYFDIKLKEITSHYSLINFKKVNHDRDHVHFSISIPPTMRIGKVVGIIKQNTAKEWKKIPFYKRIILGNRISMEWRIFCNYSGGK